MKGTTSGHGGGEGRGASGAERWPMLLCFAILLAWLHRGLLLEPRFFAEEFSVYFQGALVGEWHEWMTRPYQGYYSFAANLGTGAAQYLVTLENAPALTTFTAFAIQLLVAWMVIKSQAEIFAHPLRRLLALAVLLLAPGARHVQMSLIQSQYHAAILVGILWLDSPGTMMRSTRRIGRATLLLLAGLCGAVPNFLLPLWIFRAVRSRERTAYQDLAVVLLTTALQVLVIADFVGPSAFGPSAAGVAAERKGASDPGTAITVLGTGLLARTLLGDRALVQSLLSHSEAFLDSAQTPTPLLILLSASILVAWIILVGAAGRAVLWVTFALFVPTSIFALETWIDLVAKPGASRYHYAPGVFLLLALLAEANGRSSVRARAATFARIAALGCALTWGVLAHLQEPPIDHNRPHWESEVASFRADQSHEIAFAPAGWRCAYLGRRIRRLEVQSLPSGRIVGQDLAPQLSTSAPRLGEPLQITLTGAREKTQGKLVIQCSRSVFKVSPAGRLHLKDTDLPPATTTFRTDGSGTWTFDLESLPRDLVSTPFVCLQVIFDGVTSAHSNAVLISPLR